MKDNLTHIVMLMDTSGSMKKLAADTIGGCNSFLQEQKKLPGEATLTLATFNTNYKLIHDSVPLQNVPELTEADFLCNGFTALHDAVARTINTVGQRLAALKEEDRPSRVVFVILTDGEENRSYKHTKQQVKEMIDHQSNKYNWSFTFLGAGIDAFAEGRELGLPGSAAYSYAASGGAVRDTFKLMDHNMTKYRSASPEAAVASKDNFFAVKNVADIKTDNKE